MRGVSADAGAGLRSSGPTDFDTPWPPSQHDALLVTQPAGWVRRWWQRRSAILFRLDSKLPLSEYRPLVGRLWGAEAGRLLPGEVPPHGARPADAEPASPRRPVRPPG